MGGQRLQRQLAEVVALVGGELAHVPEVPAVDHVGDLDARL
jgi:hypothetical protein